MAEEEVIDKSTPGWLPRTGWAEAYAEAAEKDELELTKEDRDWLEADLTAPLEKYE